jgi:hypothetical protein
VEVIFYISPKANFLLPSHLENSFVCDGELIFEHPHVGQIQIEKIRQAGLFERGFGAIQGTAVNDDNPLAALVNVRISLTRPPMPARQYIFANLFAVRWRHARIR